MMPRLRLSLVVAFLFAFGGILRYQIMADKSLGHGFDLNLITQYAHNISEYGYAHFYDHQDYCFYPPLALQMLWNVGCMADVYGVDTSNAAEMRPWIKAPAVLGDACIAAILFVVVWRRHRWRSAVAAAMFWWLNPCVIYVSAYWGQFDSVYITWCMLAIALVLVRWNVASGAAIGFALATKFQAIAIIPLLFVLAYQRCGVSGAAKQIGGLFLAFVISIAPFYLAGSHREVIQQGYVDVVGKYDNLTSGAFNIWHLGTSPRSSDTAIPPIIAHGVIGEREVVARDASLLFLLTWRKASLLLLAVVILSIMAMYTNRPTDVNAWGAAAVTGLAFFLFPTEMHERYALPGMAFMIPWAIGNARRERIFGLTTMLVLIGCVAALPATPVAGYIGISLVAIFCLEIHMLGNEENTYNDAASNAPDQPGDIEAQKLAQRFRPLRYASATLSCIVILLFILLVVRSSLSTALPSHKIYLSDLTPTEFSQGWGQYGRDVSVSGGALQNNRSFYRKGIGTHAPSKIVFRIPEGAVEFHAVVGPDYGSKSLGSMKFQVMLDDQVVHSTGVLTSSDESKTILIPIEGQKTLTMTVDPTQDGMDADHANWSDAYFLLHESPVATGRAKSTKSTKKHPNIVIILLDTTRADHLSLYGYERDTTPFLTALAGESCLFSNAYSTSSWTAPAHASLFTGLYPVAHQCTQENWRLDERYATMAELLLSESYRTVAIVENPVLSRGQGYEQGFLEYHECWRSSEGLPEKDETSRAERLFTKALQEQPRDKPLFVFVNLIGPHSPYNSSGEHKYRYVSDRSIKVEKNNWVAHYTGRVTLSGAVLNHLRELYDGELLAADRTVSHMVEQLKAAGLYDETIMIITSDHGENIGDHGHMDHVFSLYESTVRVPLLIRYPQVFHPGAVIDEPVQLVDVVPTLAAILKLPQGRWTNQGVSLCNPSNIPVDRPILCEYYKPRQAIRAMGRMQINESTRIKQKYDRRLRSIQIENFKLIMASDGKNELYDLRVDPNEAQNVYESAEYRENKNQLEDLLDRIVEKLSHAGAPVTTATKKEELDPETIRSLKSIGYLSSD